MYWDKNMQDWEENVLAPKLNELQSSLEEKLIRISRSASVSHTPMPTK
jgi:hypothetical protein